MSRLKLVQADGAPEEARGLLLAVEEHLGLVPNFIRVLASSPAALKGYLAFAGAMAEGSLVDARLRAQVELAVSEYHGCTYGVASYAAVARMNGLSEEELADGRRARSPDRRKEAALKFCRELVDRRGRVEEAEIQRLRRLGLTDGQIVDLVTVSCLAIFTNVLNQVAGTEVDFPAPRPLPPF